MEPHTREHRHWSKDDPVEDAAALARGAAGGASFRILIIDDSESDRLLVRHELRREFTDPFFFEVANAGALDRALADGPYQLAITDYRLFWNDGLAVTRRLKEKWPAIPVIMFTGTGSEEVAVEAMKTGVADYIQKNPRFYGRLRSSARGALEANPAAQHACDNRYQELFDTVPAGLFKCTPRGQILEANPAFAVIAGFQNPSELLKLNFANLHPAAAAFDAWREQVERNGSVAFVETEFRTPAGAIRRVEIHARALRDAGTQQIFYEGSVEDITQRKEAEEERERLIGELREAVQKVRHLTGLLPICAACKKIRDQDGRWNMLESYIESHSHAHFTHGFCPECARQLYPEVFLDTPAI